MPERRCSLLVAGYLTKSALRSFDGQQKQAVLGFLGGKWLLGEALTKMRQSVRNPLRNYYANMSRAGLDRGLTGQTTAPFPRVRNLLSVVAPRLTGTADYEYSRMLGLKLREHNVAPEFAQQVLSGLDPKELQSPLHKNMVAGAQPRGQIKSKLWDLVQRHAYGEDRPINPSIAGPALLGLGEGVMGLSPFSGLTAAALEYPGAAMVQAANRGRTALLQKIKGSAIAHGLLGNEAGWPSKILWDAVRAIAPESRELTAAGQDIGHIMDKFEPAIGVMAPGVLNTLKKNTIDEMTLAGTPWHQAAKETFFPVPPKPELPPLQPKLRRRISGLVNPREEGIPAPRQAAPTNAPERIIGTAFPSPRRF